MKNLDEIHDSLLSVNQDLIGITEMMSAFDPDAMRTMISETHDCADSVRRILTRCRDMQRIAIMSAHEAVQMMTSDNMCQMRLPFTDGEEG